MESVHQNGTFTNLGARILGRCQRNASRLFFARFYRMGNCVPLISFTFDDFPRSALLNGGAILKRSGVRGTYYASLGLMGQHTPSGKIFLREDLRELLTQGHELGCHTFGHCHSWKTKATVFENSVIENRRALNELLQNFVLSDKRATSSDEAANRKILPLLSRWRPDIQCRANGSELRFCLFPGKKQEQS